MFGIDPVIAWIVLAIVVLCGATVFLTYATRKKPAPGTTDAGPLGSIEALSLLTPTLISKAKGANNLWHLDFGNSRSLLFTKKEHVIEILLDEPFIRLELSENNTVHMVVRVGGQKIRFTEGLDLHDENAMVIHAIFDRIVPQISAS